MKKTKLVANYEGLAIFAIRDIKPNVAPWDVKHGKKARFETRLAERRKARKKLTRKFKKASH